MNSVAPIDYATSEIASRGLARRINEALTAKHRIDVTGVNGLLFEAIGPRCGMGNEKSRMRFFSRIKRALGPRLVRIEHEPTPAGAKAGGGFSIVSFGLGQDHAGPAILLTLSTVTVEPKCAFRVQTMAAARLPSHAVERLVMRGGLRDVEDLNLFFYAFWRGYEALIVVGSEEFRKAEGRIMLPPIMTRQENGSREIVPVFDRTTGAVVTFLPGNTLTGPRRQWLKRLRDYAGTGNITREGVDQLLAESAIIMAGYSAEDE